MRFLEFKLGPKGKKKTTTKKKILRKFKLTQKENPPTHQDFFLTPQVFVSPPPEGFLHSGNSWRISCVSAWICTTDGKPIPAPRWESPAHVLLPSYREENQQGADASRAFTRYQSDQPKEFPVSNLDLAEKCISKNINHHWVPQISLFKGDYFVLKEIRAIFLQLLIHKESVFSFFIWYL